jgi:Ricin-type beta-trefoil lectin domain-like
MNFFKIINAFNHKVLTPKGWSREAGNDIVQYDDNGTIDHIWSTVPVKEGVVKIVNHFTGLWIGVTADGRVVQGAEEHDCYYWMLKAEPANPIRANWDWVRIFNKATGKALTPAHWSTANDGAIVVWGDEGDCHTEDHLWSFVSVPVQEALPTPTTPIPTPTLPDWLKSIQQGTVALKGTLAADMKRIFNSPISDIIGAYITLNRFSLETLNEIAAAMDLSVEEIKKMLPENTKMVALLTNYHPKN